MIVPHMTPAPSAAFALGPVRDGRSAPMTCAACGCRLRLAPDGFAHFGGETGRDARGCRIPCAQALHTPR